MRQAHVKGGGMKKGILEQRIDEILERINKKKTYPDLTAEEKAAVIHLKRLEKGQRYHYHKSLLYALMKMAEDKGGAILNPRYLTSVIYRYLQKVKPSHKNKQTARNTAFVFSCLCDHFIAMVKYHKIKDEFFVAKSVWDRNLIGSDMVSTSVKILKEMGWIEYQNKVIRQAPLLRVRMYKIRLGEFLRQTMPQIIELKKGIPNTDNWIEYIEKCTAVKNLNVVYEHDENDIFTPQENYKMKKGLFRVRK